MILKEKKVLVATSVLVFAMIGLVIIQFKWINRALEVQELQFNSQIGPMLTAVEKRVEADKAFLQDLREIGFRTSSEANKVIADDILIPQLRKIIDETRQEYELLIDYEFGLSFRYDRTRTHRIIFSTNEKFNREILESRYMLGRSIFGNSDGHLNLYFPNKSSYIAKQIWGLLTASLIFILIITFCFIYAIIIINRQKKLSEIKNDFINNLTHEFKTPIFSISLAHKMLSKSKVIKKDSKSSRYLDLISSENARLKNQVDKVLQMALIDSENFHLEMTKVDLHEVILDTVFSFKFRVEELGGSIAIDLKAKKNILHSDKTHLSNIIYNLMDNAVKYSKESPDISIHTSDVEEGVQFSIIDKGIGMDAEAQKYIFDKFYRANAKNEYKVKGFGLGLSYVKQIVDAHKGKVNLESVLSEGSKFTITFPVQ